MDKEAPARAREPLLAREHIAALTAQWDTIEASFEDAPERAVEHADQLTAQAIARLAEAFTSERATLEGRWGHGLEPTREDLQQTLLAYRTFFRRLITV
jgi:hypothetical protein